MDMPRLVENFFQMLLDASCLGVILLGEQFHREPMLGRSQTS